MDAKELKFLNAFNSIPNVGPVTLRALKKNLGSFEAAWRASDTALTESGIGPQYARSIVWKRPSIHPDREMERLVRDRIWLIADDDPTYPALLKEIPNPPLVLYGRGNLSEPCIAVVGTRKPTLYGLEAAESIVSGIVSADLTIVSGLATGIDTRAHQAALAQNAKTIAVLGSGIDRQSIFPPENRGLARRIEESGGAVISEYAPGTPAMKEHFPQRNRIISGLSKGTLVVEAREKSGALITARFALEQNREVFAVPGSIFSPHSKGPHALIREGAKLVTSPKDILEELGIEYTEKDAQIAETFFGENEHAILECLEEARAVDDIKQRTGLKTSAIVASLSLLELSGRIKNIGDEKYQKI